MVVSQEYTLLIYTQDLAHAPATTYQLHCPVCCWSTETHRNIEEVTSQSDSDHNMELHTQEHKHWHTHHLHLHHLQHHLHLNHTLYSFHPIPSSPSPLVSTLSLSTSQLSYSPNSNTPRSCLQDQLHTPKRHFPDCSLAHSERHQHWNWTLDSQWEGQWECIMETVVVRYHNFHVEP